MKRKHEKFDNASNKSIQQKYYPNLFKPSAITQIRVIDLLSNINEREKQSVMLMYDKKMSTVSTCIKYDKAIAENASNIDTLRNDMHNLIDEAYRESYVEIMKNNPSDIIRQHLDKIVEQINQVKEDHLISREIIEVACMKLAILCDLSRKEISGHPDYSDKEKENRLLSIPLTETYKFKDEVKVVGTTIIYKDYVNTKSTMPVFSRNGTMGFNTILFAVFNDYFPVGFSANPFSVHAGIFNNSSYDTTQHDYGHAYIRVLGLKTEAPEVFEQYKQLYYQIIEQKKLNPIDYDDKAFKEDILMLFFLVYELGYMAKHDDESVAYYIKARTGWFNDFWNKSISTSRDEVLTQQLVIETIDFIHPLQELGYKIDVFPGQGWRSAESLRIALLEVLDRFAMRHPEIELHSQREYQEEFSLA
ncbi:TPA: hypothetical protein JBI12_10455 [Legionella pneumophila]|nr:hypothetical protein [Legionella pneumophila]